MSFQEKVDKRLQETLNKFDSNKNKVIAQLMEDRDCSAWFVLDRLLSSIQKKQDKKQIPPSVVTTMKDTLMRIKNFAVFMYIYHINRKKKLELTKFDYWIDKWKELHNTICEDKQGLVVFSSWVTDNYQSKAVEEVLRIVVEEFPVFFKLHFTYLSEHEYNAAIQWGWYYRYPSDSAGLQANRGHFADFVDFIKTAVVKISNDYITKQHLILKKLLQLCGQQQKISEGGFLLLQPFEINQEQVNTFCYIYNSFIQDLPEQILPTFLVGLTRNGINSQLIYFVTKITILLREEEELYQLERIYVRFVLPCLACRAKTCRLMEAQVYEICEFYVIGFMKYCDIGEDGLKCLSKNIRKVTDNTTHRKWVRLCELVGLENPQLQEYAQRLLEEERKKGEVYEQLSRKEGEEMVASQDFCVTEKKMRMRKRYIKFTSKIKGIKNAENECYIISVLQALHKGNLLSNLLKSAENLLWMEELLSELLSLFRDMSEEGERMFPITIQRLKKKGPRNFQTAFGQQDCNEYLIELFACIENCFKTIDSKKKTKLLEQFQKGFLVDIEQTSICQNDECKHTQVRQDKSYAVTIPNTVPLQETTEETINDYKCSKCGGSSVKLISKLTPKSMTMIIHINRFSHSGQSTVKLLNTQPIPRYFLGYELVGIICHKGRNVQHGHYIYYHKINKKRWAIINDLQTEEFQLHEEDEMFEKEWEEQMTPFILFYQKSGL